MYCVVFSVSMLTILVTSVVSELDRPLILQTQRGSNLHSALCQLKLTHASLVNKPTSAHAAERGQGDLVSHGSPRQPGQSMFVVGQSDNSDTHKSLPDLSSGSQDDTCVGTSDAKQIVKRTRSPTSAPNATIAGESLEHTMTASEGVTSSSFSTSSLPVSTAKDIHHGESARTESKREHRKKAVCDSPLQQYKTSQEQGGSYDPTNMKEFLRSKLCTFTDMVPHSLLFPHCSLICHHSGAGVSQAAMEACRLQVLFPMIFDQVQNSQRLHDLKQGINAGHPVTVRREALLQHFRVAAQLSEPQGGSGLPPSQSPGQGLSTSDGLMSVYDLISQLLSVSD